MENIIVECSCQQNNLWTIITTIVPILVAIAVPCLIARKQNKITLYEKRFECYQRLESLKSFFLYVKEISSFVSSPEQQLNPAWICQQRYFSAHALLDDKDFQNKRFDYFHRISYARSCLEEDRKMLLSLGLLVGINKKDRMDKAQDALEGFIALLFNEDKKVNKGKDAAASAYEEELLQKKDTFVSEFETVLGYESRLEKKMKIETGCKVRPIKKEKKSDGNSKTTNDMR